MACLNGSIKGLQFFVNVTALLVNKINIYQFLKTFIRSVCNQRPVMLLINSRECCISSGVSVKCNTLNDFCNAISYICGSKFKYSASVV